MEQEHERTTALAALREAMRAAGLDAYVVPSADDHSSEYVAPYARRRAFISGFTGSAGTALVTATAAMVWTDGRYYLQAAAELGPEWTLMRAHIELPPEAWVVANLGAAARVGGCSRVFSLAERARWTARLDAGALRLERRSLIDAVWPSAPPMPSAPIRLLDEAFTGLATGSKLAALRASLAAAVASSSALPEAARTAGRYAMVVSALDELAWLVNARGADVPCNPVFYGFALVTESAVVLAVSAAHPALDALVASVPGARAVDYDCIYEEVRTIGAAGVPLWLDSRSANAALDEAYQDGLAAAVLAGVVGADAAAALGTAAAHTEISPICWAKARKNPTELAGIRAAHVRDGVALVRYLCWLDARAADGTLSSYDEVTAADVLESFRASSEHYVSLSFESISSVGANGAVIHYTPTRGRAAPLSGDSVYLIDSGAQYLDGTTDVTRVVRFGTASAHERACYTAVLQGHIALDTAVFPAGTGGHLLDTLARVPLWRMGLDYRHGTGHGVGAFLNVHEGPHGIANRPAPNEPPLCVGATVTNEPGYYEDGAFGMRIENVMVVVPVATRHSFDGKEFLGFEHVTWAPLARALIEPALLSVAERAWIDRYHADTFAVLSPALRAAHADDVLSWLEAACAPLAV